MSSAEDLPIGATWKAIASNGAVAVVEKLGHRQWLGITHSADGSNYSSSTCSSKNRAREVARERLLRLTDDRPLPTLRRVGGKP